ncbi:hypothetical protein DB346_06725 [Verrucomicrobia bacterium LW23]|nr:hypothetical protein DB346_06725 [Verrucomicrobia bacterium LW23]
MPMLDLIRFTRLAAFAAVLILLPAALAVAQQAKNTVQKPWPADFEAALSKPGKVTLYSLNPYKLNSLELRDNPENLYKYKVLGKTDLSAEQAVEAIAEFRLAVTQFNGDWAKCFSPRHALRIEMKPGDVYDLLLCYECSRMLTWHNGQYMFHYGVGGKSDKLNAMITAAGLQLAKPPGQD